MNSSELFLNFLARRGILTTKRQEEVGKIIAHQSVNLVEILVRGGFVKSEDLARQEAEFFNINYTRLNKIIPDWVLSTLPFELARDCGAICFYVQERFIKIALIYPEKVVLDKLRAWAKKENYEVSYSVCNILDYEKWLNSYLLKPVSQIPESAKAKNENVPEAALNLANLPIDKIVLSILKNSLIEQASEVLISKREKKVAVQFRKEGLLHIKAQLPEALFFSVVNYLKGLAHLPLSLKNNFLAGELSLNIEGQENFFSIKSLAAEGAEIVSLRWLRNEKKAGYEEFGLNTYLKQCLEQALAINRGKIVLSGGADSGLTTFMRRIVDNLDVEKKHVLSVGAEVQGRGAQISRIQLRPEIGLSYKKVLPELQRWQLDHLVIDELSDPQSAAYVLQIALTGTPVLTSVGGTNVRESLQKLLALDLELEYLLAVLNLLLAQRLVRRVCARCAEVQPVPIEYNRRISNILSSVPMQYRPRGLDLEVGQLYAPKAVGCSWCDQTGYSGKLAIHEGLMLNDKLRAELNSCHSQNKLESIIEKYLVINMLQDGLIKALKGHTTLDEVFYNCGEYNII